MKGRWRIGPETGADRLPPDRVRLVMSGKFPPYYDNELGLPEYGFSAEALSRIPRGHIDAVLRLRFRRPRHQPARARVDLGTIAASLGRTAGESSLVAFADTLSLALCRDLKAPMTLEAPARNGDPIRMELTERAGRPFEFVLAPWPFSGDTLAVEVEARPLPPLGRFPSEAEMRSWLASPARETFRATLFSA